MVKNTGIPGNQLSDLDFGQVLKDSHNKPLHALDVNQINSLVLSSYSKVSITRTTALNAKGSASATDIVTLTVNDYIDVRFTAAKNGTVITFNVFNLNIIRIA